jgi:Transcriptional regulator PadR-like family
MSVDLMDAMTLVTRRAWMLARERSPHPPPDILDDQVGPGVYLHQRYIDGRSKKVAMAGIPGTGELEGSELLILESLADGSKHGYLLTTDIATRHGRKLGPGTLYASLARLETRGLIRALDAQDRPGHTS